MTEKTTNSTIDHTIEQFNKLSIQVSLNGLSFCVLDTISSTILISENVVFEKERSPYGLLKALKVLFEKNDIPKQRFSEIIVVHRNNLFSLVPKPLFDENEMANYLKFNTKILANDHIAYDAIESYDIVNVYVPFVNINNYIYGLFGEFVYKHSGTVMIHSLLSSKSDTKDPRCYVHVTKYQLEITVIAQKRLLLYNSFNFITKEDFIYYILFTMEQLQLDTETTKLKLFGTIEEDDPIYTICRQYVKNLSVFIPTDTSYPTINKNDSIDFTVLNS